MVLIVLLVLYSCTISTNSTVSTDFVISPVTLTVQCGVHLNPHLGYLYVVEHFVFYYGLWDSSSTVISIVAKQVSNS